MASSPITSWQIDGETMETVRGFIFWGSKITADGDCSHEIKRHLLLGRKAMTNLVSLLKSRDITLPTKVCLVKAMVFPVVMYDVRVGPQRRLNAKKLMLLNCGVGEDSWESLGLQGDNQSILKEISPEYSLEGLMLKLQYFGHLMQRADSLEKTLMMGKTEGRRRRGRQRMRRLDGSLMQWTWTSRNSERCEGQGSLASCSPWGHRVGHDLTTEQQQQQGNEWVCTGASRNGNKDCTFLHNSLLQNRAEKEHSSRTTGSQRRAGAVRQKGELVLQVWDILFGDIQN